MDGVKEKFTDFAIVCVAEIPLHRIAWPELGQFLTGCGKLFRIDLNWISKIVLSGFENLEEGAQLNAITHQGQAIRGDHEVSGFPGWSARIGRIEKTENTGAVMILGIDPWVDHGPP